MRKLFMTALTGLVVLIVGTLSLAQITRPNAPGAESHSTVRLLSGELGSSTRWKCGWLNLTSPQSFLHGESLRLNVSGTATRVVVRLLPAGASPETSDGILGVYEVPSDRVVMAELSSDRRGIVQISVHGGSNPFGGYPLGQDNGPAGITSVEVLPADTLHR